MGHNFTGALFFLKDIERSQTLALYINYYAICRFIHAISMIYDAWICMISLVGGDWISWKIFPFWWSRIFVSVGGTTWKFKGTTSGVNDTPPKTYSKRPRKLAGPQKERIFFQPTHFQVLLLMEEILHHLGCIKPYEYLDIYSINWLAGFLNHQQYNYLQVSG